MMTVDEKRESEKELVTEMILLYCKGVHKQSFLCPECRELTEYSRQRSDRCPRMENKTFCSNCPVHCYKPEMREKIRAVMRYAGPRMIFHHPIAALRHVIAAKSEKRRLERKNEKQN